MRRPGYAITLVLVAVSLGPAEAAAAPPSLAATTTITGTRAAAVSVRLTRPAVLRDPLTVPGAASDVVVTGGGGGFAGFVLRSADGRLVFAGGRLVGPAASRTFVTPVGEVGDGSGAWRLPAGTYRLYLLTAGGPTTVRLRLHGLSGSVRLAPASPRAFTLASPAPALAVPDPVAAKPVYSVGGTTTVNGSTLSWSFLYHVHDVHTETDYWACTFLGKPTSPAPYAPGCIGGARDNQATHLLYSDEHVGRATHYLMSSNQPLPAGDLGQGVWMATATPATEIGYTHFWLTY